MISKLGGRKYSLALLGLIVLSVGLFVGVVDDDAFVVGFAVVLGGYGGANLVQKFRDKR
jgi:hypothetical protein